MGFLDKVKNMFTEEVEDDDVRVEQIKKEVTHVAIDSPSAKDEEDDFEDRVVNNYGEENRQRTSKPVFFDDNDFKDLNLVSEPKVEEEKPKVIEKELYNNRIEKEPEEKKIFKPTPIISPVYGILDKNYHKEDIVSKNDVAVETKNNISEPSIDSIRNKAYGTLEDELENTLFGTNSILFKKEDNSNEKVEIAEIEDDILSNLTEDISKELDELLIKKEKYIDDDVEEEEVVSNKENDDDLLEFIDSTLYKNGEDE